MKINIKVFFILLLAGFFQVQNISSEEEWVVSDIRISGLQRVSAGSVFNVMPIAVGDTVNVYDLQTTAKTIFKTGQFDDIQLGREANTLIYIFMTRLALQYHLQRQISLNLQRELILFAWNIQLQLQKRETL